MAKGKGIVATIMGWPQGLIRFAREARDELKKVSWPSRQATIRYTIVVVVGCLVVGAVTGGVDYLLTILLGKIVLKQ
jgi:preprotein translocase SecE subunit